SNLDKQQDDALPEQGEIGGDIGDGEAGDANGTGSHKEGVNKAQRCQQGGAGEHEQDRAEQDKGQKADDEKDGGVEIEVIEEEAVAGEFGQENQCDTEIYPFHFGEIIPAG